MELARKILDELMGPERNKMVTEKGTIGIRYSDPEVCKFALVEFCPFELFMNTKSDIGTCPCRYHDESLKEQFTVKGDAHREHYEREFLAFLEGLVNDLERRLRRGKERLEVRPNDPAVTHATGISDENEERRILLDLQLKELLTQIETCGNEGRIREAQELASKADAVKADLDAIRNTVDYDNPLHKLERPMELCRTCGAFLIVNDAPQRIEAHYQGRQHNGWVRIRAAIEQLRQKWSGYSGGRVGNVDSSQHYRPARDGDRERGREREPERGRDFERDRDRDRDHGRDRIRERVPERERDHGRDRERDYGRDRDRDYGRDRERDHGRERERDHGRDRERDHSRRGHEDLDRRSHRPRSLDHEGGRPTGADSYVPGAGLNYELGELPEDGEIRDAAAPSRRSRSRSASRDRSSRHRSSRDYGSGR